MTLAKRNLVVYFLCILLSGNIFHSCTQSRSGHHVAVPTDSLDIINDSIRRLHNPVEAASKAYQLDTFFTSLHKKRGFNGTVLVAQHGQVIYKGAFGYGDFKTKDTLTPQSTFQLASVSKQFTAMAVMILQEKGKLSYDDEVTKFYPEFPYKGITVRHLLTHRSGLPDYTYFSGDFWPDRKQFLNNQEVIKMMAKHQPKPYYLPDKRYNYSNTGYSVLAAIVEKVSGLAFDIFMQKEVFGPLGMNRTYISTGTNWESIPNRTTGYSAGRRKIENSYLNGATGDKGVYSTVEDLYKWDRALYGSTLVKPTTLELAFTAANKEMKKENYGFGWRLKTLDCGETVVYHGGWWHGFKTYLMRNRKDQSTIIVLSNIANHSLSHLKEMHCILYPQPEVITVSAPAKADSSDVH
ncbi:beta-lactamase family protein [Rhodocytophaga rosea]|uniref:Beta-lactamase family protein n=1 Tax=Rhodocytophaga rosea TaxID=2704465 RepID=A0A6C0GNH9_9BACT|nr:serine hydrolase domain-containing protein [Rhodocytophaga rosea]QHT69180.1 beta-lactamase family protein [Rhodocytophaga rosea]